MKQIVDIRVLGIQDYSLLSDVYFETNKWCIYVSKGFRFDGASIPRMFWEEIGCPIDFVYAGCIHDALYRTHLLSRKEADYILYLALIESGVSKVQARVMYLAVRAGGQQAYDDGIHMMAHYRNYAKVIPKL